MTISRGVSLIFRHGGVIEPRLCKFFSSYYLSDVYAAPGSILPLVAPFIKANGCGEYGKALGYWRLLGVLANRVRRWGQISRETFEIWPRVSE